MSDWFERAYGHNEANAASSSPGANVEIVPARENYVPIIRRIRGNVEGAELTLESGTTGTTIETVGTGQFDVNDLFLEGDEGESIEVNPGASTSGFDITVQYAYRRVNPPGVLR